MNRRLSRLGLLLTMAALAPANPERDSAVGTSYQIPYRRTETNHFLVRVRVNGKGPFNFLVDSGAPALYIATKRQPRRSGSSPERMTSGPPLLDSTLRGVQN